MLWRRRRDENETRNDHAHFEDRHARLTHLLHRSIAFWKDTVDWNSGGFYGLVDYTGRPQIDAPKNMMQQVRHLWAFSEYYRMEERSSDVKAICDHQFRFVRDCLYIPERADFHLVVNADGSPRDEGTHLYNLGFGVFGLANYASVFPHSPNGREALQMAMQVFTAMVENSFDETHGFDETIYPERWCSDAKEINTQMHLLEAITSLLEAVRIQDDPITAHVEKILGIQLNLIYSKAIVNRNERHFCSRGYDRDWTLVDDAEVDFGHEIEVVHLVMAAAKALGRDAETDILEKVVNLGRTVSATAFDSARGKWFYSGDPISGKVLRKVSNYWTNFEALLGLGTMYQLTGDNQYLVQFDAVLSWLETKQLNKKVGEWYYNVNRFGRPVNTDVFNGAGGWMTFGWKSSYHGTRTLLHLRQWISDTYLLVE
jgi:mannose/cellobiose epimerase-like protein (N-acyl-D-glucosamine 2-epimerase family)